MKHIQLFLPFISFEINLIKSNVELEELLHVDAKLAWPVLGDKGSDLWSRRGRARADLSCGIGVFGSFGC